MVVTNGKFASSKLQPVVEGSSGMATPLDIQHFRSLGFLGMSSQEILGMLEDFVRVRVDGQAEAESPVPSKIPAAAQAKSLSSQLASDYKGLSDRELMGLVKAGVVDGRFTNDSARGAADEIQRRWEPAIRGYCRAYMKERERLWADAVQETFLNLFLKAGKYDSSRELRPWLYTIATNACIDLTRRNSKHLSHSLEAPAGCEDSDSVLIDFLNREDPEDPARVVPKRDLLISRSVHDPAEITSRRDQREHVLGAMRRLVDAGRLDSHRLGVFYLRLIGFRYAAISDIMSTPESPMPLGTVKSRLYTVKRRIGEELELMDGGK